MGSSSEWDGFMRHFVFSKIFIFILFLAILSYGCQNKFYSFSQQDKLFNESFTDFQSKSFVSNKGIVISATKQATKIGREILNQGGSASDALIAMQMAIGVTEPHASSLGGGGMFYNMIKKGKNYFLMTEKSMLQLI